MGRYVSALARRASARPPRGRIGRARVAQVLCPGGRSRPPARYVRRRVWPAAAQGADVDAVASARPRPMAVRLRDLALLRFLYGRGRGSRRGRRRRRRPRPHRPVGVFARQGRQTRVPIGGYAAGADAYLSDAARSLGEVPACSQRPRRPVVAAERVDRLRAAATGPGCRLTAGAFAPHAAALVPTHLRDAGPRPGGAGATRARLGATTRPTRSSRRALRGCTRRPSRAPLTLLVLRAGESGIGVRLGSAVVPGASLSTGDGDYRAGRPAGVVRPGSWDWATVVAPAGASSEGAAEMVPVPSERGVPCSASTSSINRGAERVPPSSAYTRRKPSRPMPTDPPGPARRPRDGQP